MKVKVHAKDLIHEPMEFVVEFEPSEPFEEVPEVSVAYYNSVTGELWFEREELEIDWIKRVVRGRIEGIISREFKDDG